MFIIARSSQIAISGYPYHFYFSFFLTKDSIGQVCTTVYSSLVLHKSYLSLRAYGIFCPCHALSRVNFLFEILFSFDHWINVSIILLYRKSWKVVWNKKKFASNVWIMYLYNLPSQCTISWFVSWKKITLLKYFLSHWNSSYNFCCISKCCCLFIMLLFLFIPTSRGQNLLRNIYQNWTRTWLEIL